METAIPIVNQHHLAPVPPSGITVERLSAYLARNNNLVFPHRHDFYQCVLFTNGTGHHVIDFEQFEVSPWQIYFMTPAQIHIWSFRSDMEGYLVNFSPQSIQSALLHHKFTFFNGRANDAVFTVDANIRRSVQDVFEQMIENREDPLFCDAGLQYLLHLLASRHHADPPFTGPSYSVRLLVNFLALLESNYKVMRLPKDFASLLYITPNHLNALCKEHIGLSTGEIIRNRVLLEAKRLLSIRDMNVSEIADELNFRDNSYFSKFFKKIEGLSPEEFRNRLWKKI